MQPLGDLRDIVLRHGEHHRDGLQLGDHNEAVGVGGLHVVARIDQAQADAAVDRRDDVAVSDIELLGIDLGLVHLHRALVLLHQIDLVLVLLARHGIGLGERLVAREIHARLIKQTLVARELPFGLLQRGLVGPRIDLREEVALLDELAFLEADIGQLAIDLRPHRHGRERRHRAERVERDVDVAFGGGGRDDRHRRRGITARASCRLRGWPLVEPPCHRRGDRQQNEENPPREASRLHR